MIVSIWRYSHLILAVSSFVFITIASVTGAILSLEPVNEQINRASYDLEEVSVADLLPLLQNNFEEVFSVRRDNHHVLTISAIDKSGHMGNFYLDPEHGESLGPVAGQSAMFEFATSLHRSLFLNGFGRLLMGISCFCLLLIPLPE